MSKAVDPNDPFPHPETTNNTTAVAPAESNRVVATVANVIAGRQLLVDLSFLVCWIAITDFLIYRTGTFFAWGVFLLVTIPFLGIVKRARSRRLVSLPVAALMLLLSLKLIWGGSFLQIYCGLFLLVCFSMALSGSPPFLPEVFAFCIFIATGGVRRLSRFRFGKVSEVTGQVRPVLGSSFLVPAGLVLCFAALFVLANPDLANSVAIQVRLFVDSLQRIVVKLEATEAVFWLFSGWLILGLMYPACVRMLQERTPAQLSMPPAESNFFAAARNTLVSLSLLFAVYLAFEFATLGFREFPSDFYYAGYAHQGAFWLTLALALSTLVLSATFQGDLLRDPRLPQLKRFAVAWSGLNLLLAAAVFNRLFIYIDFNGMTRMRVVGLLGIGCVVAGFALVVIKLWHNRDFVWLLHRQLWVPAVAAIIYAILPVDWLVHRYNVAQVLSGRSQASVQIVAHETSAEGMLALTALVDCDDLKIRSGIRALLALWAEDLETPLEERREPSRVYDVYRGNFQSRFGHKTPWLRQVDGFSLPGRRSEVAWLNYQISEQLLIKYLESNSEILAPFRADSRLRDKAIDEFFEHAFPWY